MSNIAYSHCAECNEPITYDDTFYREPEPIHIDCKLMRMGKQIDSLTEQNKNLHLLSESQERIAALEAELAEADKFGMQNRELTSENLSLKKENQRLEAELADKEIKDD